MCYRLELPEEARGLLAASSPSLRWAILHHLRLLAERPATLSRPSPCPPYPPGYQLYEFDAVEHGGKHRYSVLFKYADDEQTIKVWGIGHVEYPTVASLNVSYSLPPRMTFQLMITCLADVLRPGVGQATVRLLRRLGHEVTFPEAQTCCGQPLYNSGFADLAREQAKHTIAAFSAPDPVVTPSGSCAAMVKVEYPELLAADPVWGPKARALAERTYELSDLLVNRLGVTDVGARYEGQVAYHSACHLRMLGQQSEVDTLLAHVAGLTVVPLARQDQCCGFGGSFAVRYPNISTAIVDDKVRCLDACGADTVVSTDTGCLMNLGGRLRRLGKPIKVLHLAELLAGE